MPKFAAGITLACAMLLAGQAAADPLSIAPPGPVTKATLTAPEIAAPQPASAAKKVHYNIVVFGDSLGDGVWAGLYHVFRKDRRFSVIRKSRVATGFVRQDYFDWNEAVREAAADTTIDIAVVVMGTNDRQTIVDKGNRYSLFDPKWREIYNGRVDDFTATLKASGARIYWMGLPVMRSARFERDMETFTGIFEKRAAENGVTFIPTHDVAADEEGNYEAYGVDRAGRKQLLRAEDGIHFTMEGYERLARKIGGVILADVDGSVVTAKTKTDSAASTVAAETTVAQKAVPSAAAIGLKTQGYDVADIRAGRSDDWRWTGAALK